eukprot:14430527-Alexandrium_andersonii.AAC.1
MDRVQGQLLREIPLALTPVFSFPEVSFADDTVIISKVSWVATRALQLLQREAAKVGLFLNMGKTKELAMNSEERVHFAGGKKVPRVKSLRYLGTLITDSSDLGAEIGSRVGMAKHTFKKLQTVWTDPKLSRKLKLR